MSSENSITYRPLSRFEVDSRLPEIIHCIKKNIFQKRGMSVKEIDHNEKVTAAITEKVKLAVDEILSCDGIIFIAEKTRNKKIVCVLGGNNFEKSQTDWKEYQGSIDVAPRLFHQTIYISCHSQEEKEALKQFALHWLSKNSYEGIVFERVAGSKKISVEEKDTRISQLDSLHLSQERGYLNLYLQTYDCDHSELAKDIYNTCEKRELKEVETLCALYEELWDNNVIKNNLEKLNILSKLEEILSSAKSKNIQQFIKQILNELKPRLYNVIFEYKNETLYFHKCISNNDAVTLGKLINFADYEHIKYTLFSMLIISIDLKKIDCIREIIKHEICFSDLQSAVSYAQKIALNDPNNFKEILEELLAALDTLQKK